MQLDIFGQQPNTRGHDPAGTSGQRPADLKWAKTVLAGALEGRKNALKDLAANATAFDAALQSVWNVACQKREAYEGAIAGRPGDSFGWAQNEAAFDTFHLHDLMVDVNAIPMAPADGAAAA